MVEAKRKSLQIKKKKRKGKAMRSNIKSHFKLTISKDNINCKKKCSTCFGKRLYSPYFFKPGIKKTTHKMTQSTNGLSIKETSFLMSDWQRNRKKYTNLKTRTENAIKNNKIFSINGSGNGVIHVREALKERGWIEKIEPSKISLIKLRYASSSDTNYVREELSRILMSNMVAKCDATFFWNAHDIDNRLFNASGCYWKNKLDMGNIWTSKQGLCRAVNEHYWYHKEDVSEIYHPRTYISDDPDESSEFTEDFKLTACTNLLKWMVTMKANEKPVFEKSGTLSINVFLFALSRCKEYLLRKQNKDIDRFIPTADSTQWHCFLTKYYSLISNKATFKSEPDHKISLYLECAKLFLKEILRYKPQLSCEGCHNIWIIKPDFSARGYGIRLSSKLGVIKNLITNTNSKYVIQKYVEDPLLIHDTKFDIRQYFLITSTQPLVVWMYKDCYLKFSSQNYTLKTFHESVHLTNNAIQKKYTNSSEKHGELPKHNMWNSSEFQMYLNSIDKGDVWDKKIYPGMRKSILGVMLSCLSALLQSNKRFELFGCDFIIDKFFKPWLIEINSNPDMKSTTETTAKICPEVIRDLLKVVLDYPDNAQASTGKFTCIYRQPHPSFRAKMNTNLSVIGRKLPLTYFYQNDYKLSDNGLNEIILKRRDIKDLVKKLVQKHESCRIVSSLSGEKVCGVREEGTFKSLECTESENELNETASLITGIINCILENIEGRSESDVSSIFL